MPPLFKVLSARLLQFLNKFITGNSCLKYGTLKHQIHNKLFLSYFNFIFTNASPISSPESTNLCKTFNVIEIISGSLVFKFVFSGTTSYGITGRILPSSLSMRSNVPIILRKR